MNITRKVRVRSLVKPKRKFSLKLPNFLRLLGLKNFSWLIGLTIIGGVLHFKGTPKILWEYTYTSSNRKTSCTYIGLSTQTIPATSGDCSIFVLLKD